MLTAPSGSPAPVTEDIGPATAELALGGMHCHACATRIAQALAEQPAVLSASVNLATSRAIVTYDATGTSPDDLCAPVSAVEAIALGGRHVHIGGGTSRFSAVEVVDGRSQSFSIERVLS